MRSIAAKSMSLLTIFTMRIPSFRQCFLTGAGGRAGGCTIQCNRFLLADRVENIIIATKMFLSVRS
jgi:hypothetical protein